MQDKKAEKLTLNTSFVCHSEAPFSLLKTCSIYNLGGHEQTIISSINRTLQSAISQIFFIFIFFQDCDNKLTAPPSLEDFDESGNKVRRNFEVQDQDSVSQEDDKGNLQ